MKQSRMSDAASVEPIEQAPSSGFFCPRVVNCVGSPPLCAAALPSDLLGLVSWCFVQRCAGGKKKTSRQDRKEEEVHMAAPERKTRLGVRQNTGALPLQPVCGSQQVITAGFQERDSFPGFRRGCRDKRWSSRHRRHGSA